MSLLEINLTDQTKEGENSILSATINKKIANLYTSYYWQITQYCRRKDFFDQIIPIHNIEPINPIHNIEPIIGAAVRQQKGSYQ